MDEDDSKVTMRYDPLDDTSNDRCFEESRNDDLHKYSLTFGNLTLFVSKQV